MYSNKYRNKQLKSSEYINATQSFSKNMYEIQI